MKQNEHLKNSKKRGLSRIISATFYSIYGLKSTLKNETAFRQEVVLFTFMLPVSFWIGNTVLEYLLLVGSCFFILVIELLNSAVEAAIDRVGAERHPLSKQAKDMASAAVFLSFIFFIICWLTIGINNYL